MFYDNFIKLCSERNIKPTPLVTSMGLSSSNVSQWRDGSIPRADVLLKLSDYFGVSMRYFLTGEKEKPAGGETSGLSEEEIDLIQRFRNSSPEIRAMMLGALIAAEAARTIPDGEEGGK